MARLICLACMVLGVVSFSAPSFSHVGKRACSPPFNSLPTGRVQDHAAARAVLVESLKCTQEDKTSGSTKDTANPRPTQPQSSRYATELSFLAAAATTGAFTGGAVTLLKSLIGLIKSLSYGSFMGLVPSSLTQPVTACIPLFGALAVIVMKLAVGDFTPGLQGSVKEVNRQVPFRPFKAVAKSLAAVGTLGTGNSLGPEGPSVEIGVGVARRVGEQYGMSVARQRMLLASGAAAGVAAGFNAPIAGVFFALEIVDDAFRASQAFTASQVFTKSSIAGTLLCAVTSALVARIGLNEEFALKPAPYFLESPLLELPLYLGLGLLSGYVAIMFRTANKLGVEAFSGKLPGTKLLGRQTWWAKLLIASSITGLVGLIFPQILFFGYDTLDNLLANTGGYGAPLLITLCLVKAVVTAICSGAGLVGGAFAPALFLGATAGSAYHTLLSNGIDNSRNFIAGMAMGSAGGVGDGLSGLLQVAEGPAYAMVGAASVLAATFRAPLTGSLLLFELTKDYDIVLPLMASAGVASLVVELFINREQDEEAEGEEDMLSGLRKNLAGTLYRLKVEDALQQEVVVTSAAAQVTEVIDVLVANRAELAVVTDWGKAPLVVSGADLRDREEGPLPMLGMGTLMDFRAALERPTEAGREVTVRQACKRGFFTIEEGADLATAREIMDVQGVRYLPVVRPADEGAAGLVGVVSRETARLAARIGEMVVMKGSWPAAKDGVQPAEAPLPPAVIPEEGIV
ncbi:unnamed protein product, partial [Chrysoparadoxa australica]